MCDVCNLFGDRSRACPGGFRGCAFDWTGLVALGPPAAFTGGGAGIEKGTLGGFPGRVLREVAKVDPPRLLLLEAAQSSREVTFLFAPAEASWLGDLSIFTSCLERKGVRGSTLQRVQCTIFLSVLCA